VSPENVACSCRNNNPARITSIDDIYEPNLFNRVEIDYKMEDVSAGNVLGLIKNRLDPRTPFEKRLNWSPDTTGLVFINGHGGSGYYKI